MLRQGNLRTALQEHIPIGRFIFHFIPYHQRIFLTGQRIFFSIFLVSCIDKVSAKRKDSSMGQRVACVQLSEDWVPWANDQRDIVVRQYLGTVHQKRYIVCTTD